MKPFEDDNIIFTIGHSTHSLETFIGLLRQNRVTAVADVRSTPYSQFQPQFNRESLKEELKKKGIQYVFLGDQLGARSKDPACYVDGKVQYGRLARTALFHQGLERLRTGRAKHRIAIMCAEKEPLECHRTLLVAKELAAQGIPVEHIHADGHTETHTKTMERLLNLTGSRNEDMFRSLEERMADALARQEEKIAFVSEEAAKYEPGGAT